MAMPLQQPPQWLSASAAAAGIVRPRGGADLITTTAVYYGGIDITLIMQW